MISFEGHIKGEKPVLVDFHAKWCGPCKMMTPILQEVKKITGDRATILKIDIDENPAYSQQYQVYSVPTLIIFQKGKIVWRKTGVAPAQEILRQINKLMVAG
jgi:thioredoxin 1